ncbi:MAG TPA: PAS domain S-box protein, partial [Clostridia bacterium]|nr:PAS domain S-box protein [Clostridia bacterium]
MSSSSMDAGIVGGGREGHSEPSSRWTQFALDHAPDAVLWLREDGRVIYVNEAACHFLGYTKDELLSLTIFDINPEYSPEKWAFHWREMRHGKKRVFEARHKTKEGRIHPVEVSTTYMSFEDQECLCGFIRDISERKQMENALEQRLIALTAPVESTADLRFEDLFDLQELQKIQDAFAAATGVASIITDPNGRPITKPSNFCRLCQEVIRKTEKGLANCYYSDRVIGRSNPNGPTVQPCLSGGLWDGGASIRAGERHIANWLIGQVLDDAPNEETMVAYAREIGANETEFREALRQVTRMPKEQFAKVCQALFLIADQLSRLALQNLQQARSITERKRVEEALRQSERRFSIFMSQLPACVHIKDQEGRIIFANDYLRNLFGWTDCVGRRFAELLPGDLAETIAAQERKAFEEGLAVSQTRIEDVQGEERIIENRRFPIHTEAGQVLLGCVGVDITEAELAEQKLRASDARLRAIIEGSPFGAHSYELQPDDSLILVGANRSADKILGVDHLSLLGKTIEEAFPGLARTEIPNAYRRVASGGDNYLTEHVDYDQENIRGAFEIHAFQTGPNRMSVFFRDITERRRAEVQVSESERKYRELVELANSIILRWTPEGRITFLNEFGQKFLGYTAEEIIGRHVVGTIVPETESTGRDLRPLMEQVCANPKAFELNINENLRRNGERVWIAWTNRTVLDEKRQVKEVLSVGTDITERRRLEEQLRQAQKMEAIGQLAGGVAHDFNNILTVILGNAGMLRNSTGLSAEHAAMTHQIVQAAERAAALTRQLLLFSRKQVMQVACLDLNTVVGNMTRMLQRILGEDVSLHADYAPVLPTIAADAGMVEQVLLNLAVNARDAMPGGGRLTIQTSSRLFTPEQARQNPDSQPGAYVCLTVSDTGCGIPEENIRHIFEPFFTTKPVGKGTGLGLATVYGILQQHRGWIEVESRVHHGTTFRTFWPADTRERAKEKPASDSRDLPHGNEVLLVVEDEIALRQFVGNFLKRCGYTVFM